jgi:PAS domain S-box-containing protein
MAFGKTFLLQARSAYEFDKSHPPRAGWLVLISGLAITMTVTIIIGSVLNRRKELEMIVAIRTGELEKNRTLLETLIRTLPDLIWLKDPKGVYIACNPRLEQFIGAKEADIIGKTDYDLVDRDLADFFQNEDKEILASGRPGMSEAEITFASDGHKEILQSIKTPMYGPNGVLIGVLGIAHDITAQRQAELALRAERDLFTAGPVFTIAWAPAEEWPVTFVSDNVSQILGYTPAEMTHKSFRYAGLIHPDDLPRISDEVADYISKGIHHFEQSYRLFTRSGEYRWFYDYTHLIRNGRGDVSSIHGYLFDQTDLKNTEIALQNSFKRTTALMDAVQAGIILVRRSDRVIVEANPVAIRMEIGRAHV